MCGCVCCSLTEALPGSLEAVLEAAHHTAGAKAAADMEHWQLHQDIILQHFGALLSRFAEDSSTQVCFQPLFCFGSPAAHADTALLVCTAAFAILDINWNGLAGALTRTVPSSTPRCRLLHLKCLSPGMLRYMTVKHSSCSGRYSRVLLWMRLSQNVPSVVLQADLEQNTTLCDTVHRGARLQQP